MDKKAIQELLSFQPFEFVVADIGQELNWIPKEKSFEFWKKELQLHLSNDYNHIDLTIYPNNYVYVPSLWMNQISSTIILLEKYH